jgi:hypothetical protein
MRQAIKNRDPRIYGDGASSWNDALDDAVQGLVVDRLLSQGQLAYVFEEAISLRDFRALMVEQARRHLAKCRVRTVIDQLLERSRRIINDPASVFEVHSRRRKAVDRFALAPLSVEARGPTPAEMRGAQQACLTFPILHGSGGEHRAPPVYSTQVLEALLMRVCETLPCVVSMRDLHELFSWLLTDWVVSDLDYLEEVTAPAFAAPALETQVIAVDSARALFAELNDSDRGLLAMTLRGERDAVIAAAIGASRQTVIARRKRLRTRVEESFDQDAAGYAAPYLDELHLLLAQGGY